MVDGTGKRIYPWDPTDPSRNINSCPNDQSGKDARGRESARIPPNLSKKYLDGSKYYVEPENTENDPISGMGQSVERGLRANEERMRAEMKIKQDRANAILRFLNLK